MTPMMRCNSLRALLVLGLCPLLIGCTHIDINHFLQPEGKQFINEIIVQNGNCMYLRLNRRRTCQFPEIYGRLSGPELSVIKWKTDPLNHTMQGCWQVSRGGRYFLELILLRCDSLKENFSSQCLQISALTLSDAAIQVHKPVGNFSTYVATGKWISTVPLKQVSPLHFRYQKPECFNFYRNKTISTLACDKELSIDRYSNYTWVWNDEYEPKHNTATTVCIIGDSHAVALAVMPDQLRKHFKYVFIKQVQWPLALPRYLDTGNPWCDVQVIQLGQWPASFIGNKPHLVQQYANEMASALVKLQNRSDILVLNVHYSPISAKASTCPPIDWRVPDVIDEYNRVLKKICSLYNIQYVDTISEVLLPLWDSGRDYCHYKEKVGEAEAAFLARVINKQVAQSKNRSVHAHFST